MPCIISYGQLENKMLIKFHSVRQRGNLCSHGINDNFKENIKNFQAVQKPK